jgi:hypothetical protein
MYKGTPKLFKINPVLDHSNSKFKILNLPYQNILVEDSLTSWKDTFLSNFGIHCIHREGSGNIFPFDKQ